ncbi:YciI family protein [Methylococcus sp. Mc7]|uniref:YciI family protein n=1 Tax=Methylococcus sp. Mc7 TaxID=2860258 RepID=UPI001C527FF5|nr:YciI family protein [Methylococcus sp. Mc7]QXP85858.1 YciI family protein [Methylococcus sp. Mc7]
MRYMIIVKATKDSEAGVMPSEELLARMGAYHEELARAGVLLDGSGLKPSREGWRIRYEGEKRRVTDGPFTETKELIAGYTLIQVRDRDEAMEWVRRFPNPAGDGGAAEIEVRPLFELEDFGPSEAVARMHEIGIGGPKK